MKPKKDPITIVCRHAQHGAAINDLADRGVIQPVWFTTADNVRHKANSVWAAVGFLSAHGWYEQGLPIEWDLVDASTSKE